MSPRPLDSEPDRFAPSLALARQGRHAEAVARLLGMTEGALHASHRAAATGVLSRVAQLAQVAGDLETAEQALVEALRIAPRYPDLHYQHACVLLARQRPAEARAALDAALGINPRYVAARVERALLDAREGLLGEALATLRTLGGELDLEEPRLYKQGLESLAQADWDAAGEALRRAVELTDPGVAGRIREFHALVAAGRRAEALDLVRETLADHPSYADLHYLMGCLELEEGWVDDALASLGRALELHPNYHDARVQLARALETLGDVSQAGEQVALVLERDPEHPLALQLHERWSRRQGRRHRTADARKAS